MPATIEVKIISGSEKLLGGVTSICLQLSGCCKKVALCAKELWVEKHCDRGFSLIFLWKWSCYTSTQTLMLTGYRLCLMHLSVRWSFQWISTQLNCLVLLKRKEVLTYTDGTNAWMENAGVEIQALIDQRSLLRIDGIQAAVLRLGLDQIAGDGTWFPQVESIVVQCWHRVLRVDAHKRGRQLLLGE